MQDECRIGVGGKLATLLAAFIGVKRQFPFVEAFEQDHPHVGKATQIDGGKRHRFGIVEFAKLCLLEPAGKQPKRFVDGGEITTP